LQHSSSISALKFILCNSLSGGYSREIEMLRALLDEANSNIFASENSENTNEGEFLSELKPLAEKILSKIKKAGEE